MEGGAVGNAGQTECAPSRRQECTDSNCTAAVGVDVGALVSAARSTTQDVGFTIALAVAVCAAQGKSREQASSIRPGCRLDALYGLLQGLLIDNVVEAGTG